MNGDIPGSCRLYRLQLTDVYTNMFECIDTCINLINNSDEFTIVGWYKRGVPNGRNIMARDKTIY